MIEKVINTEDLLNTLIVSKEEQLFELPQNWTWVKSHKVIDIQYGKGLSSSNLLSEGYPVYGANGRIGYYSEYTQDEARVLMTCRGATCGTINVCEPQSYVTNNSMVFKPKWKTDIRFIKYLLMATKRDVLISGSAQPQITIKAFEKYYLPLPPLSEQNRIAEKVERLFGKIDEAKRLIEEAKETFELRRAAILEQAFIGELTKPCRESINSKKEEYLNNILKEKKSLYEELLKRAKQEGSKRPLKPKFYDEPDSYHSLVDIPNTWNYTYLGNVIYDFKYGTSRKSSYENEGKPVIRIPNIDEEYINLDDMKYLAADGNQIEEKVEMDDLLIIRSNGSRNLVGKCAIVDEKAHGYAYASYLIRMRTIGVYPKFIYWLMKSDIVKRQLFSNSKSSAGINNINTQELASIVIPIPSKEEQMEIVKVIEKLISKEKEIYTNLSISSDINSLKQSVLSKAFRGELGTNNNNDESAIKLLKSVLQEK